VGPLGVTDFRKTLPELRAQWDLCRGCSLGAYREQTGGSLVMGEGAPGGVMVIGAGPARGEETAGRCFVDERGSEGQVVRDTLERAGLTSHVYLAYCVSCRACAQAFSSEGQPLMNFNGKPYIRDQPPTKQQLLACAPRLYEEIYLVDPVLIVTLGQEAAEMLLHRTVSPHSECGSVHTARIPGAAHVASITEKKKQWLRKVRGTWVSPVAQNYVEYSCLICLSPADVLRSVEDRRYKNPTDEFVNTIGLARVIYDRYLKEVGA